MPPTLYVEFVTDDSAFDTEIRGGAYPNGLCFDWTETVFAYGHRISCWPAWGPTRNASEMTDWSTAGFSGTIPAGMKMRGPYEVYLYGINNFIANVINPNIDAWVADRENVGDIPDADTYTGDIVLDFGEEWTQFSFSYFGATTGSGKTVYQYFKDQTGLSANAARAAWENIVTSLYHAIVDRLRLRLPKAKIGDPYIAHEIIYQMDDSAGAPGSTIVTDTGRTVKAEIQYQYRGRSPTASNGGLAGWLMSLFSKLDWVDAEAYAKVGYSTVDGANVNIGGDNITTSKLKDTEFYMRLHFEELVKIGAAMRKPVRMWLDPTYAIFNQGSHLPATGLNVLDAALFVSLMKQYGINVGMWIGAVSASAEHKQGIRDGLANLNPYLARAYNLPTEASP